MDVSLVFLFPGCLVAYGCKCHLLDAFRFSSSTVPNLLAVICVNVCFVCLTTPKLFLFFPYFASSVCLVISSFFLFSVPVEFANCYGLPFCACLSTCLVACGFFGVLFSFRVDFVHVGLPYEVFLLLHACWLCFWMNDFAFSKPGILFMLFSFSVC